jgi:hypothetical protein
MTRKARFTHLLACLTIALSGCSIAPRARIAPDSKTGVRVSEPRPARTDRSPIGHEAPEEPPSLAEALLFLPALFFAGATFHDDVVSGPPRSMLVSGMLRQKTSDRTPGDWLPARTREALQRAFHGTGSERDLFSPDRPLAPPDDPEKAPPVDEPPEGAPRG